MILRFLNIWFSIIKYYFYPKELSFSLIKYFIYFTIVFYLFNKNLSIAFLTVIAIYFYKAYLRLHSVYQNLIPSLPISPMLQIIIEDHDPADILLIIPTIIFVFIRGKMSK